MPPVFGHGRLRLYLLKLLNESPRHGYEVIRLLEERFQGLYSPSAGTVYPRLAKLAAEGLVAHTDEGGRKVYSLTEEGERELAAREHELAGLEREIRESLAALAADIQEDVSGSARSLREELHRASKQARGEAGTGRRSRKRSGPGSSAQGERTAWQAEEQQEAMRAAKQHFEQAAQRIQEQVRRHADAGTWQSALREGMEGLSQEIGGFSRLISTPWPMGAFPADEDHEPDEEQGPEGRQPVDDPSRELERLLDRFRDQVRDAARDEGVTQDQLRIARRHLSTAEAHLVALLRNAEEYRKRTGER
jgi:DNA-binding PadR family transcriptional regulator